MRVLVIDDGKETSERAETTEGEVLSPITPVKSFAIIGTSIPDEVQVLAASTLAFAIACIRGYEIHTGGEYGIDQKTMEGTRGKNLTVYLPWSSYNRELLPTGATVVVYNPIIHTDWTASVNEFHTNSSYLSGSAFSLHARNFGIIHGRTGVVAFPDGTGRGGTEQGIRIANALQIPLVTGVKGQIGDAPRFIGRALQTLGLADPNLKPIL